MTIYNVTCRLPVVTDLRYHVSAMSNGDLRYDTSVMVFYLVFRAILSLVGLTWLAAMAAIAKELLEDIFFGEKFATQRVSEIDLSLQQLSHTNNKEPKGVKADL